MDSDHGSPSAVSADVLSFPPTVSQAHYDATKFDVPAKNLQIVINEQKALEKASKTSEIVKKKAREAAKWVKNNKKKVAFVLFNAIKYAAFWYAKDDIMAAYHHVFDQPPAQVASAEVRDFDAYMQNLARNPRGLTALPPSNAVETYTPVPVQQEQHDLNILATPGAPKNTNDLAQSQEINGDDIRNQLTILASQRTVAD